jgi:predicted lipoprotein with Yx(FWY)xxD motif
MASAALLAGCSGTSLADESDPAPTAPANKAPEARKAALSLIAANTTALGKIIVTGDGWTVYRFELDTTNPPTSHCTGTCEAMWPAVIVRSGDIEVQGIDRALVGTWTRPDGTQQLTVNGWLAYRYAGDKTPGDTNGQGVSGTWYAFTPEGQKATAVANGDDSGYRY